MGITELRNLGMYIVATRPILSTLTLIARMVFLSKVLPNDSGCLSSSDR